MRKKKILWHSDPPNSSTGFGNYTKYILSYLYKTGKYEIANFGCGLISNNQEVKRFPWKSYPAIPLERQDLVNRANQDPNFGRILSYGEPMVDEVVKDFKPDIYVGNQDFWGYDYSLTKKFWNKITCVAHWTADSIPLLDNAVSNAHKIEHHYVWAKFAETEFKRLADELEKKLPEIEDEAKKQKAIKNIEGWRRVKTLSGCVNNHAFYRLPNYQRQELREKYNIDKDAFIISSGSRSQLRKLFPQSIEAFAMFKKQNPSVKAKMIFWTSVNEGWNLEKHCLEHGVDLNDVLFPYRCRVTGELSYMPFKAGDFDNPKISEKNSMRCVGMENPAPEYLINEFLNLADLFVLCITSGGFELFLSQAKLTEIPTISNSYSCFEEQVGLDKGTLPVDENFTYEIGTGFKKSAVFPFSIAKAFKRIYDMDAKKRHEIGKAGRDFVLKNYSIEVVAKQYEELLDALPYYEGDWNFWEDKAAKLDIQIPPNLSNKEFVFFAYREILQWPAEDVNDDREDLKNWIQSLDSGLAREKFLHAIWSAAQEHNKKLPSKETPEQWLRAKGVESSAVLVVQPKSAGDILLLTALFKSLKEQYPDRQLVLSCEPQYFEILDGNPYLDKVIEFQQWHDNQLFLQGIGNSKSLVFKSLHPYSGTQRFVDYIGDDKLNVELYYR